MPNWCYNSLVVQGAKKHVEAFKQAVKDDGTDLSLDKLHPMPKKLKNTVAHTDDPNWYDWRMDNWGTRSEVEEAKLAFDVGYWIQYFFLSAWTPPIKWLEKVASDYPELNFIMRYAEAGNGLHGRAEAKNGEVEDQCLDTT